MEKYLLWDNENIVLDYYPAKNIKTSATVLIFPGGAYAGHADYEGEDYAKKLNTIGMSAFVLKYRVAPNVFPAPLLDARRAMRFIRFHAEKFGVDKGKILVAGSSAGGHLAALLSTYREKK